MSVIVKNIAADVNKRLRGSRRFAIGMALITREGLDAIVEAMNVCLARNGAKAAILFGVDLPTEPAAIKALLELADYYPKKLIVRRYESGTSGFFHPKLYLFESSGGAKSAILGSANLTGGGFGRNVEANVGITDRKVIAHLWDEFEEHFEGGHAKEVDETWLAEYRKTWEEHRRLQERWRDLVQSTRRLPSKPKYSGAVPERIKGYRFLFTGKIDGLPRPELRRKIPRLGGVFQTRPLAETVPDCLVHGKLPGDKETVKLKDARERHVPIIYDEQFLDILANEKRLRKKERSRGSR